MNELHGKSNADLLQVATSKNYGKSTRSAAREILAERGVTIDDATFANPSAGNVPQSPPMSDASRMGLGFIAKLVGLVIGIAVVVLIRYALRR